MPGKRRRSGHHGNKGKHRGGLGPVPVGSETCRTELRSEDCARRLATMLQRRLMGAMILAAFQHKEVLPGVHFGDHGLVRVRSSVSEGEGQQEYLHGWYVYVEEHTLCGDERVLERLGALLASESELGTAAAVAPEVPRTVPVLTPSEVVMLNGTRCRLLHVF